MLATLLYNRILLIESRAYNTQHTSPDNKWRPISKCIIERTTSRTESKVSLFQLHVKKENATKKIEIVTYRGDSFYQVIVVEHS